MLWYLLSLILCNIVQALNLWNSLWLIRTISSATLLPYLIFLSSLINHYYPAFSSIKLIGNFDVEPLVTESKNVSISFIIFFPFLAAIGQNTSHGLHDLIFIFQNCFSFPAIHPILTYKSHFLPPSIIHT